MEQRAGRIVRQGNQNEDVFIYRYVTEKTFDSYLWQTVENKQRFISQIMTSKSPVRSCEDVDETALSYAEIKALCAGDGRIKEKMDLDIDVAHLRLMKADHLSRQYRLEDQVLKYFPLQIEQCQANITGFRADMQTLAEHPVPERSFAGMETNGRLLNDKDAAGHALLNACKDAAQAGHAVQFGSYRGLTMRVDYDSFSNLFYLTLRGQMSHRVELSSSPLGNLVRIENALSAIPDRLAAAQAEMENQRQQMDAAKLEMQKPFPQEEELKVKSARLAELDAQLDMDSASTVPEQEKTSIRAALKEPGRRGTSRQHQNHEEER